MLPYSRGLILENSNNYGIVKTETLFGFGPSSRSVGYNQSDPVEWILAPVNMERSLKESKRVPRGAPTEKPKTKKSSKPTNKSGKKIQGKKRKAKKVNKCIIKFLKKNGKRGSGGGGKRGKIKFSKKKFLMPLILGVLAAKSVLIPVALKALAFMSAKGLMFGFLSTVMASVLSLKGMFDNTPKYHDRKDEKTQVEIIQVPTKDDHHYYDDYRRTDFLPLPLPE